MTYKPTTARQDADLTASQGETGHEDQYETDFDRWLDSLSPGQREQITRDIEAARDLIDRERYPEPCDCTEQVARAAIAAAEPHIRAEVREQIARELIPVVAHKGPNDTDLSLLDEAAHKLEHGYSFGSNVTAAVVRLIRNAIRIARQEQP